MTKSYTYGATCSDTYPAFIALLSKPRNVYMYLFLYYNVANKGMRTQTHSGEIVGPRPLIALQ